MVCECKSLGIGTEVQSVDLKLQTEYRARTFPPRLTHKVVLPGNFIKKLRRVSANSIITFSAPPGFGKTTLLSYHRKNLIKRRKLVFWLTLTDCEKIKSQMIDSILYCINTENIFSNKSYMAFSTAVYNNPENLFSFFNHLLIKDHIRANDIVFIFDDVHKIEGSESAAFLQAAFMVLPENLQIILSGQLNQLSEFICPDQMGETGNFNKTDLELSPNETKELLNEIFDIEKNIKIYSFCHTQSNGWPLGAKIYFDFFKNNQNLFTNINASRIPELYKLDTNSEYQKYRKQFHFSLTQIRQISSAVLFHEFDSTIISTMSGKQCTDEFLQKLAIKTNIIEQIAGKAGKYKFTNFGLHLVSPYRKTKFAKDVLKKLEFIARSHFELKQYEIATSVFLVCKNYEKAALSLTNCAKSMIEKGACFKFLHYFETILKEYQSVPSNLLVFALIAYSACFQKDKFTAIQGQLRKQCLNNDVRMNDCMFEALEDLFTLSYANENLSKSDFKHSPSEQLLEKDLFNFVRSWQLLNSENFELARRSLPEDTLFFSRYNNLIEALSWLEQGFIDKSNQIVSEHENDRINCCHTSLYFQVMRNLISCLKTECSSIHFELLPHWDEINDRSAPQILDAAYKSRTRSLVFDGNLEDALELIEQGIFTSQKRSFASVEASLLFEKINILSQLNENSFVNQLMKILIDKTKFDTSDPFKTLNGNHPQSYALLAYLREQQVERNDAKIIQIFNKFNFDPNKFASKIYSTQLSFFYCHSLLRTAEIQKAHQRLTPLISWLCREKLRGWLIYEPQCLKNYVNDRFENWRELKASTTSSIIAYQGTQTNPADLYIFENLSNLTPREREVLEYLVAGHDNKTISKAISVSIETIKWHIKNVYQKLGIQRREHLISVLSKTYLD